MKVASMKLTLLVVIPLIFIFIFGCQKGNDIHLLQPSLDTVHQTGLTIEEGKLYFGRLSGNDSLARQETILGKIYPRWFMSFSGVNEKQQRYIEVPVTTQRKRVRLFQEENPVNDIDKQKQKASAFRTLVIFKGKTGKIYYRFISYIGSPKYLQNHNGDISHNRIGKIDSDFEGYLNYSDQSGKPLFSLKIENGRPVKKINNKNNIQRKAVTVGVRTSGGYEVCETYCNEITEWTCWETYVTICPPGGECYDVESGEQCGNEVVYIECWDECYWVEEEEPNPPCYDQTDPNGECDDLPCEDCGDGEEEPTDPESAMGVDCSSFSYLQTTSANWQEAGLNQIRLKWVWIDASSGHSISREIWIDHVVFGLPVEYGNGVELTAGEAATLTAKVMDQAKTSTYQEFRRSPYMAQESTVVTHFINKAHSLMTTIGGTAGKTGSGSSNIVFRNEQRGFFGTLDCQ